MESIKNLLEFLYRNWTSILICAGCIAGIFKKTKDWRTKSKEERAEIAKTQIRETMLNLITRAEIDYETWSKSGSIKRSQVIKEIFDEYPILSQVANQEEIIEWIDIEINNSLKTLREIVKENTVVDKQKEM